MNIQDNKHTKNKPKDKKTNKQTINQTNKKANKQANKQTNDDLSEGQMTKEAWPNTTHIRSCADIHLSRDNI